MKRLLIVAIAALALHAAAAEDPKTSPSPSEPWRPPASAIPPRVEPTNITLPPGITPSTAITLPQIIDIALTNNPDTRAAWLSARAAQAGLGVARSAYYPEIDVLAAATIARGAQSAGGTTELSKSFGPSLGLIYRLFDFGGRRAEVEQARQALIAADYTHNQAIQDVILGVQQAYYGLLANKALLNAETATLKERQRSLDTAEARHDAGVATIADVLQAKTALSQARLNYETIEGQIRAFEGSIATAMGLQAGTKFDFGDLPLDIPANQVMSDVDALIARAVIDRPDLAAARAEALRAQARVQQVRSEYLPSVVVTAGYGLTWFGSAARQASPYSASVGLRWPVFTGFKNRYDTQQARLEADVAVEDARSLEQRVTLDVWTSYFAVQTSTQRLATSRDLLTSAQQSVDATLSRYRSGVGSIIDLLTAESALESARAQEVQARTDWFLSIAQLAHATGTLER